MAERNVLLKNVKHPFLVGLHYSFQTTEKLYFVLDFVNGGEVCGDSVWVCVCLFCGSVILWEEQNDALQCAVISILPSSGSPVT